MVYQPPSGARDLLPIDVAQKQWIEERLQQVFHRWGYHRIITSTLERLETLMAGGAVQRSTVIQLQETDEEVLGLRPELTASIARAAVTRMVGAAYPQRLYYAANVFRKPPTGSHSRQQEFYQAGVELLGGGGLVADAEILLLLADCLQSLGLNAATDTPVSTHLILGEAELTRSLLSVFPAAIQDQVRGAIAHLDRIALETLPLTPELRDRALLLLDLRGKPADVLQRVSSLDLDPTQRDAVNNLKSLVELLEQRLATATASTNPRLILDLSLIQTFDYYTGIVFEAVSSGAAGQRILGQGGRYDQLLGLYHPQGQSYPGIGFSFNLEEVYQVLLTQGQLPQRTPASDWLVVPQTPADYSAAFAYSETLRDASSLVRVELELSDRTPEAVREYAKRRHIARIAWISTTESPQIETVS